LVAISKTGSLGCRTILYVNMPTFVSSDQCDGDLKTRIGQCLNYLSFSSIFPTLRSIAFPALGTGRLQYYPADVTAKYMFKHFEEYLLTTQHGILKRISFIVSPADTQTVQVLLIQSIFKLFHINPVLQLSTMNLIKCLSNTLQNCLP